MASQQKMQKGVAAFNEICFVGDEVIVEKDNGQKIRTTVLHPAQVLSGHTPVVWLRGISGCYALNRVTVITSSGGNSRETIDKAYGITRKKKQ